MSKAQPGSGYGFTSSGYGFTFNTEQPFAVTDNPQVVFLKASIAGDKVSVSPGTVNRYIPKIASTFIDASTPPTITVEGPGYVLVKATYEANKFFPRTAVIVFEPGTTVPADTNTDGYYPLGRVNEPSPLTYTMTLLSSGNLVVNRLKAGNNIATWWWDVIR